MAAHGLEKAVIAYLQKQQQQQLDRSILKNCYWQFIDQSNTIKVQLATSVILTYASFQDHVVVKRHLSRCTTMWRGKKG